jgi:diguanylate cyclase (GGDEF)-like protein/PAS domain S-box-containing protein
MASGKEDIKPRYLPALRTGEGEAKYHALTERMVEMLYLHDLEGNIVEVNNRAVEWTGYTKDELCDLSVFELHPSPIGREEVVRQWRNWKPNAEVVKFELAHRRKDGTVLPVEVTTGKILIGGDELILALTRDISEQHESIKLIEESREWYRTLAEEIPMLVTRISPEGKITYLNKASSELIGRPQEELLGNDFYDTMPEEYRDEIKRDFAAMTPGNPVLVKEHYNRSRLFRWKNRAVFDHHGQLNEYFTVGEDITAYKESEAKLRASEARSRALISALPDLIFRYSRDGYYIDAEVKDIRRLTEKGRKLYQVGKLIGSHVKDVLSPSLMSMALAGIEKVCETGQLQILKYSYPVEGRICHHEARMVPYGPDEVISIVRDVTEGKLAEEALEYQLRFEQVVADISTMFVSTSNESIDEAIMYALKLSGQFFAADRSYVFRFSEDGRFMTNTHEWCAKGITSQIERNQHYPVSDTPWMAEQAKSKDYVYVHDIEALPTEMEMEKNEYRIEEIKSFLCITMYEDGNPFGYLGFDAVKEKQVWTEQQIALLKVVAEIIGGAIIKSEVETALKDSEERYRDILATIEEGYYEADLAGRITFCNDAACQLFGGYRKEEVIGCEYSKFYMDPAACYEKFHHVFTTGVPEKGLMLEMIRKDGSIGFGEISITLVKDKEGYITGFKGIGRDVTARIEYEKQLEYISMHDQLTGIYNRAYFEVELERLSRGRDFPLTIISADLDGLKLINDTMGHETGDNLLKSCVSVIQGSLRQSDIFARVGGDEFTAILPNTDKATGEDIVRRVREAINQYNRVNEDLPIGISMGVATADKSEHSLKDLFKRADDMMYRDKLYRSSSSRSKIVQSLLAALAERDYITEGHARRLEELCRSVGEKIALSSNHLADLALLAQVHDLGKVGVPDHILFKPGPLTDEEWEVMRTHPEKGYRIASSSPDLVGIADLILKHHERWDGSGYPLQLAGKEIPVECRILSIVDAFDAMTNQRPYNKTKSVEEAIVDIEHNAGSQFDPELVPVFKAVLKEERV